MVDLDTVVCQNDCSGHGKCQQSTRCGDYNPIFGFFKVTVFHEKSLPCCVFVGGGRPSKAMLRSWGLLSDLKIFLAKGM